MYKPPNKIHILLIRTYKRQLSLNNIILHDHRLISICICGTTFLGVNDIQFIRDNAFLRKLCIFIFQGFHKDYLHGHGVYLKV